MKFIARQYMDVSLDRNSWLPHVIAVMALLTTTLYSGVKPPPPVPDLTKRNNWKPISSKMHGYFNLGPTGMMGVISNGSKKDVDQVFVDVVTPGSPAFGKIVKGDLILGVSGKRFKIGDDIILLLGNAINEAEKDENGGKLTLTVWHDDNWARRAGINNIDVTAISVDDILKDIESESDSFTDWRTDEQQAAHMKAEKQGDIDKAYEECPIKATTKEVTLTLKTLGTFSKTAPWDCKKTEKIREQAWKVLAKKYETPRRKRLYSYTGRFAVAGMAILASGNQEYIEQLKKNIHADERLMAGERVGPKEWWKKWMYGSWHCGYTTIFLAEYYLKTGDKAILPSLREWARGTARIQTGGGTWGHSSSVTAQNFGELGGPAPGYGAMNQAAGPCFYGLTLAHKAGINDPLVVDAIKRSVRYYSAYVDKGGVPYGVHGPVLYEDSNGKSGPPAFAMRMAGEPYKANYYAMCSAVGSSWGYRGGHGDGTFGNYWPQLAAGLAGKEAVAMYMKKMHPYYTMLRRYDGSFVSIRFGRAGGIGSQFDPTAMAVLAYSLPLQEIYTTGREPVPEIQATPSELIHLKDRMEGKWRSFSTDEIISKLDTFSPELRRSSIKGYPSELVTRYNAGEKDIVQKLIKQLDHEAPRMREGALYSLTCLGRDACSKAVDKAVTMLNDPAEVVRIGAVALLKTYTQVPGQELGRKNIPKNDINAVAEPLFATALKQFENDTMDHLNTPNALQGLMINTNNSFANAPFNQGYDANKVSLVLERFLTLDPRQDVMKGPTRYWGRDTVVRIAGPLMYTAENFPLNGIMFGGSAPSGAKSLLAKNGFIEALEASCAESHKITDKNRKLQVHLQATNLGWFSPTLVMKYKGAAKPYLPWLRNVLVIHPNLTQEYQVGRKKHKYTLENAIRLIEQDNNPEPMIRLRTVAMNAYYHEVDALGSSDEKVAYCRNTLEPERKTYYRQMAAMTKLIELLGSKAVPDLAPYYNHEHWRFSERAQQLVIDLKAPDTDKALVELTASKVRTHVAGALKVLAKRGDTAGLKPALALLSDPDSKIRGAAAMAVYGCSDGKKVDGLLKSITSAKADYDDRYELFGYEDAFQMRKEDPAIVQATSSAIRKAMSSNPIHVRRSLYYVLGQLGGPANLSFLKRKVEGSHGDEFRNLIDALSWSTDIGATNVLADLLTTYQGTPDALIIADLSVKRMVNGGKVLGQVPDDVNLDFAQTALKSVRNLEMIKYMGNIHRGRCLQLLYKYMKLGPDRVTSTAAQSIIRSTEGMSKDLPLEERKAAAEVLAGVVEYINIVHTRQDVDQVGFQEAAAYARWKKVADNAGLALKRLYDPTESAIDTDMGIEEDDLDL